MADNTTFITGAAEGAFADALNGLPPWATENTAGEIESILRKTLDIQKAGLSALIKNTSSKNGPSLDAEQANTEFRKLVKLWHDENKLTPTRKKYWKDEEGAKKKNLFGIKGLTTSVESLDAVLSLSIVAGSAIAKAMTDNVKTYDTLTASGINLVAGFDDVSSGFDGLRQLTALTSVRYTELAASMIKYSAAVNSFTTGKFAKSVGMASGELAKFGFNAKESGDLVGVLLDAQMGYSNVSRKTADETYKDAKKLGESIFRLSIATGMEKNAIMANITALSKSVDASVLAARVGNTSAASMVNFLSSFKDQDLAHKLMALVSQPITVLNDTFMNFQKGGMGGFGQQLANVLKESEGMSDERRAYELKNFIDNNKDMLKAQLNTQSVYAQAGNAASAENLKMITQLRQQAEKTTKHTEKEMRIIEESNAATKNLATAWEALLSKVQGAFSPTIEQINTLTIGLTNVNKGIDWLVGTLNTITGGNASYVGAGLAVISFGGIIWKVVSTLFGVLNTIGTFKVPELLFYGIKNIFNILSAFVTGIIPKIGNFIFESVSGFFGNIVSKFGGIFGGVFSTVGEIAGLALKFLGVIGLLYTAFETGFGIGTILYKIGSKFNVINDLFDTILKGVDKLISYLPGSIGSNAQHRLDVRAQADKFLSNGSGITTNNIISAISVPKSPSLSTVNSPSAVPANASTVTSAATSAGITTPVTPMGPGIEKAPKNADINSMMAFQNSVLEQLLLSTNNLVSVNRDILRYTRIQ